jgi:hypothetical protein
VLIADICYICWGEIQIRMEGYFQRHIRPVIMYMSIRLPVQGCVQPRVLSTSVVNSWPHCVVDSF